MACTPAEQPTHSGRCLTRRDSIFTVKYSCLEDFNFAILCSIHNCLYIYRATIRQINWTYKGRCWARANFILPLFWLSHHVSYQCCYQNHAMFYTVGLMNFDYIYHCFPGLLNGNEMVAPWNGTAALTEP